MKKLLLASAAVLALASPAAADSVTIFASDTLGNSGTFGPDSSGFFNPAFNIGDFNVNQVTAAFRGFPNGVTNPVLSDVQTLDIDNSSTVADTLTIDVRVTGTDLQGLQGIASRFDSVGLTPGWSYTGQTFVNGLLQASASFTDTGGVGPLNSLADFGVGPWTIDSVFTIGNSGEIGSANVGIHVETVPGPIVGAGLPGLLSALGFGGVWWRRRKKKAAN